jgi:hypothetical protein
MPSPRGFAIGAATNNESVRLGRDGEFWSRIIRSANLAAIISLNCCQATRGRCLWAREYRTSLCRGKAALNQFAFQPAPFTRDSCTTRSGVSPPAFCGWRPWPLPSAPSRRRRFSRVPRRSSCACLCRIPCGISPSVISGPRRFLRVPRRSFSSGRRGRWLMPVPTRPEVIPAPVQTVVSSLE